MSAPATAAELVEDVLSAMADASDSGSADALAKLRGKTTKEGKASPLDGASSTGKAKVTGLEAGARTFPRPNGELYHVRKLDVHDDVMVVREARRDNLNVLAYGPPGTGKTALIEAAFNDGFYGLQGNGDTITDDFVGSYVQTSGTTFEWMDGPLVKSMEEGVPFYIDEIALIDPKVLPVVYGVMDGRGELVITQNPLRGTIKAAPGFYVIAACNPNAPGARMSEALLSRFPLQFEVKTDYKLALRLGVPQKVVTAAQNMDVKRNEGGLGWCPQLRELLDYVRVERKYGPKMALRNMISTAPEMDRKIVSDVLSKAFGEQVTELRIS